MEEKAKQYLEESKKEKDYRQTNNEEGKKEERIYLSNDTLNTFVFFSHMVSDMCQGLLLISNKESDICTILHTE